QVLVGLALSQASTLGTALAIWLGELAPSLDHHEHHGVPLAGACLLAVVAAHLMTSLRGKVPDATAAWIWLACSAGSVLLLAHSPHGTEEVETLMFSTLIGASELDLYVFGTALLLAAVAAARWSAPLLLTATDLQTARALGLPATWITRATAWMTGLGIGLALHATGTLFTFGYLVLPALTARHVCRRMRSMLWVAPSLAIATSMVAFVLAHGADLPPAQVAVMAQAALLLPAWLIGRVRHRRP
ncbi:MAG: metal ABC transporter permease, partial [Myxococcales bacterium]|nr:metal ABC transporter permease [Myxococcales bacterium]